MKADIPNQSARGGLYHLVEAATALTQLVHNCPPPNKNITSNTNGTHAISDDDEQAGISSAKNDHIKLTRANEQSSVSEHTSVNMSMKEIFPQRLLRILSQQSISDIITWLPHGRSFVIIRPDVFADKILPEYFPESCASVWSNTTSINSSEKRVLGGSKAAALTGTACKYPSFTRKLNRWGFRQVSRGPDAGAFHHDLFHRDKPELCLKMVCQKSRKPKLGEQARSKKKKKKSKSPQAVQIVPNSSCKNTIISNLQGPQDRHMVTDCESVNSVFSNHALSNPSSKRDSTAISSQIGPVPKFYGSTEESGRHATLSPITPLTFSPSQPNLSLHQSQRNISFNSNVISDSSLSDKNSLPSFLNGSNLQNNTNKFAKLVSPTLNEDESNPAMLAAVVSNKPDDNNYLSANALLKHNMPVVLQANAINQLQNQVVNLKPNIPKLSSSMANKNFNNEQISYVGSTPVREANIKNTLTPNVFVKQTPKIDPETRAQISKKLLYKAYLEALMT
mmetsp:Transcript_3857/g.5245  ORF Transcript_3857/g.5245 Transcript_3857/m.5245 type:complete len:507 (+) Transcript_3857:203-1723(+)|eukprot:CAMPEP_0184854856 /NCGR_PEP_ID=MMETSP0580-20130426/235_1 /TAXON_ID=1118495 /ORGANISM="Dactyliosolen fragilissimus" /LENGTH=506 /DNA_ID=CAMNT_0027349209 /DNA_START=125 /DNA_END=1645 /DNA_ORIENTATION=-